MKRGLKYVFIAFSPDEVARYFYESFPEDILNDGIPKPEDFKKLLKTSIIL